MELQSFSTTRKITKTPSTKLISPKLQQMKGFGWLANVVMVGKTMELARTSPGPSYSDGQELRLG